MGLFDLRGRCQLYLGGVTQVLGEDVADSVPLSHPLPQVGQLTSLCLDQRVVLPVRGGGVSVNRALSALGDNMRCIHPPRPGGAFPLPRLALQSGAL